MLTRLLTYIIVGGVLMAAAYFGHASVLDSYDVALPYSLFQVYLFHAIGAIVICISFDFIYEYSEKFREQLGFLYIGTMIFKIILFCIVFHRVLFFGAVFSKSDSGSMLIPLFLFLFYEVFFIAKILNKKA